MDLLRNRLTAVLAAAAFAVALPACGDDDDQGVGEQIEREAGEARDDVEREAGEAAEDVEREGRELGDDVEREAEEGRDRLEQEGRELEDDVGDGY